MKNLGICLFVLGLSVIGCDSKPAAKPAPSVVPSAAVGHPTPPVAGAPTDAAAAEKKDGDAAPAKEGDAAAEKKE